MDYGFELLVQMFGWIKSKLHGKDNTIKPEPEQMSYHMMQQFPSKEEISGCPSSLLAIGTFGNNLEGSEKTNVDESLPSSEDHQESTTLQEFAEVDKELRLLISGESENYNLSTERLLDSLRDDEEIIVESMNEDASEDKDALLQRTTSGINKREKDIPKNNKKNMYRKSVSFLLKKAVFCRGGFVPSPIISSILKDPFPDPKFDNSTKEKVLRAMLNKKKYPKRQKYLDKPETDRTEEQGKARNENKWDKTDSEYIVLEL
ncbi:hypothetical protein Salat_1041000 [Sesamum alatum]|uniref:Uncharacterized protein n=1 Tax=Sesamum alatum TaxID=300844 RepID=A0AAE1YMV9_9LAMI|nr:hypothetical protein Salat_1041000 [Sesamum alatum]